MDFADFVDLVELAEPPEIFTINWIADYARRTPCMGCSWSRAR